MTESNYNTDVITTLDTLYVTTNTKVGSGGKGYVLVDDGTNVVQKATGTDNYILTYDTTSPDNIKYKPYLVTNNIGVALTSTLYMRSSDTRYAQFNIRKAMASSSLSNDLDFYNVPFNCFIESIELIVTGTSNIFSWPTCTSASQYAAFSVGYATGATFTPFGPINTHFTVSQATPPFAGVTNFSRSASYSIVRFVPASVGWTWNVTAGTRIGIRMITTSFATGFTIRKINAFIYLKGSF